MAGSRRQLAAAAVVVGLGVAGCNALLGLGQFAVVDCAFDCGADRIETRVVPDVVDVNDANDAGDAGDAGGRGDSAGGFDAPEALDELAAPEAASPHQSWAHWPMPNPDASIAPDSSTRLPNQMSYDAGADAAVDAATVFDTVTGLTWEVGASPQSAFDYSHAAMHCQSNGMRLPTRIELVSLIDFTRSPAIDMATFPDTQPGPYWSSSVVWADGGPGAAAQYWSVSFYDGLVAPSATATYVRCVTGGAP